MHNRCKAEPAQNTLVRSCLYAVVAITVDLLWGYTGILTFGQATFFGIGAYAAGLVFTPHLVPMTRGILATVYCRGRATTRARRAEMRSRTVRLLTFS